MQYRNSRQEVTGLVVNKRINVRYKYRRTVRAMVHSLLNEGSFETYRPGQGSGSVTLEKQKGTVNQLHGMLGFIDSIDLYHKKTTDDYRETGRPSSKELMYRRFLIYINFFAAEAPVILCEGETDNVYLTHAIRSLAADFPELAAIAADGKITLKVRLYKYRRSSTARILGLKDGGSSLSGFISTYDKETAKFKAPGRKHPVIVLYDNDSGAKGIHNTVKQVSKKSVDSNKPFTHVIQNLYVVPTPLVSGVTESKIEDFFEPALKATQIGGKTFNDSNNIDSTTEYGKQVFAHAVVVPNAKTINFHGFRPLLANLTSVITAHRALLAGTP